MAEKVAEQITLTVGEAFDLAYKVYLFNLNLNRFITLKCLELYGQKSDYTTKSKASATIEEKNRGFGGRKSSELFSEIPGQELLPGFDSSC